MERLGLSLWSILVFSMEQNLLSQVVHARGLFSEWKQIVYTEFDTPMTKEILFEIIKELQAVGAVVRGISFDNATDNWGLLKSLKV
jgi:hypothetical protein